VRAAGRRAGEDILRALDRVGARVLRPDDADFPPLLGEIAEPPVALYVWGNVALLSRPCAAIVGSRTHTPYGAAAAQLLAGGVALAAVVVSGMARGLDAIAHQAALDANGATVGVLGNGFGVVYPAANRPLYDRVSHDGCLVTELAPGERPRVSTFPRRNRIIAGLAGATVVVEAAVGSGALITADCALDQGRSVLAVPGPITSPTSVGCNKLIQQGAKPALCVADVLEELGLSVSVQGPVSGGSTPGRRHEAARTSPPPHDLTALQRTLWDALTKEATHVDALLVAAGQEAGDVLTALTDLELRGLVAQRPGMMFELRHEE
jgi:DNA processing protein